MTKLKLQSLLPTMGLLLMSMSGMAFAQSEGGSNTNYEGWTPRSQSSCPSIAYQFRGLSTTPVGYVWFMDASGMSKATGTMDLKTGKFSLGVTSLDGNGPTGEVEGVRDPKTGVVTAQLKGPGCSQLTLLPMPPAFPQPNG